MEESTSFHPIRDRIRLSLIVGVALAIFGSAVYYAYVSNHDNPVRYPSGIPAGHGEPRTSSSPTPIRHSRTTSPIQWDELTWW